MSYLDQVLSPKPHAQHLLVGKRVVCAAGVKKGIAAWRLSFWDGKGKAEASNDEKDPPPEAHGDQQPRLLPNVKQGAKTAREDCSGECFSDPTRAQQISLEYCVLWSRRPTSR